SIGRRLIKTLSISISIVLRYTCQDNRLSPCQVWTPSLQGHLVFQFNPRVVALVGDAGQAKPHLEHNPLLLPGACNATPIRKLNDPEARHARLVSAGGLDPSSQMLAGSV